MKNLLAITSRYPHLNDDMSNIFVQSQIEELRKHFERVVIISTTPRTPIFLTKFMIPQRKKDALARDYQYENVEVYFTKNIVLPINTLKNLRGQQGYKSARNILNKIKFKPDIIHAHFSWPSGYISVKLKEKLNVPVVITIHENHDWLLEEEKKEKVVYAWKNADALIRVNKLDVPLLKKYNSNTYSIPNGYLTNKFKPMDVIECKKLLKLPANKHIIFSLGHLIKRKGFHDLIDAAHFLAKKRSDFLIVIGGDGAMRSTLEEKIKSYHLGDQVRLVGYIPDKDVPIWMNAADFFVLPSYSEGNPTVMFETLGCGKPFISTNVGGVPEIINDEKLGILFPPGDVSALSSAIHNALEKEWDTEYIVNTATKYSWDKITEHILVVYDNALKKTKSNRRGNLQ